MEDLMHLDLYGLLEISQTSTTKEIKTAYRKKALSCHPDKNPDNPKAGELFHQLSKILEILTDTSARSAYDKVLLAKAQAKIRSEKLDAKRKKFKDDLEAREESFRNSKTSSAKSDEEKLREEIERLQREGSKLVEEEVSFINQQIHQQMRKNQSNKSNKFDDHEGMSSGRVKIKWRADKNDDDNGGYSHDVLKRIFSKYGDVVGLVVSGGKRGRALVEFRERSAAEMAVNIEMGLMGNPLVLEGLWEGDEKRDKKGRTMGMSREEKKKELFRIFPSSGGSFSQSQGNFPSFSSAPDIFGNRQNDNDFESLVLGNLRRAEERKKLIEQMTQEDENS